MLNGIKVGGLYKFQYAQGTYDAPRLGRVLKVRDIFEKPVAPETIRANPNILRSRFLLTVREWNGRVKSMYSHSIVNAEKVGWFRSLLLRIGLKV